MPKLGEFQISQPGDYEGGYHIEEFTYSNFRDEPGWCVPGWMEGIWPEMSGPFESREEAERVLALYRDIV